MTKKLLLAGGCFWCVEHDMRKASGVSEVISGYAGGESVDPSYEHHTGHKEVVEITYDTEVTSYRKILQHFIDHIDPTDTGGQFGDRGESYKTAIFYADDGEKIIAEKVLAELDDSHVYAKSHAVELLPDTAFYRAEEYHQNYAEKNAFRYSLYHQGSGREDFVNRTCQIRDEKKVKWSE